MTLGSPWPTSLLSPFFHHIPYANSHPLTCVSSWKRRNKLHDEMMAHMKEKMTEACWMPLENTQAGIIRDMTSYLDEFKQK
jgi:hypothetical protein